MCFEFEYLYWAKLEEEARMRDEEARRLSQAAAAAQDHVVRTPPPREPTPA